MKTPDDHLAVSSYKQTIPFIDKMEGMELSQPNVHAPEFPQALWVNTLNPITLTSLRGQVVLINFWDFTCINCIRTLPYLRAWHRRYSDLGLTIIGVHTPEFAFARDRGQVKMAVGRLGILWPVLLDNDQIVWQSYANRYWPTIYLLDADGYIRYQQIGDRGYAQAEEAIQTLLKCMHPEIQLPNPLAPLRPEDALGAVCYPTTPELQADAIGNREKPIKVPTLFQIPQEREQDRFYLGGWWQTYKDGLTLVSEEGTLLLKYHAASVNAVLAPTPDPVEQSLALHAPNIVELYQDDNPLSKDNFTEDLFHEEGTTRLRVDHARTYALIQHEDVQPRELLMKIHRSGFTMYAFSFGTCLMPQVNLFP